MRSPSNQAISCALLKVINLQQDGWNEQLDAVLFSYRANVHASTKFIPFYLMYDREAVLPIALKVRKSTTTLNFENLLSAIVGAKKIRIKRD